MKKLINHKNLHYSTLSQLRGIIRRLKAYGYEREGKTTYSFKTKNSAYYRHLVKDA